MKLECSPTARGSINYYHWDGYTFFWTDFHHGDSSEGNNTKEEMTVPSLWKLVDGSLLYYLLPLHVFEVFHNTKLNFLNALNMAMFWMSLWQHYVCCSQNWENSAELPPPFSSFWRECTHQIYSLLSYPQQWWSIVGALERVDGVLRKSSKGTRKDPLSQVGHWQASKAKGVFDVKKLLV